MEPCRVGEKARAISITVVGGSERETLLRPHVVFAGSRKIPKRDLSSESPTIVMLMARAFSPTLQGPISFVHKTNFRFLFYALSQRFWYITRPPTRLAPEVLTYLVRPIFYLFIGTNELKQCTIFRNFLNPYYYFKCLGLVTI